MHELSVTKQIIQMVQKKEQKKKITKVFGNLGKLTTYKTEPIKFYFNEFKKDYENMKESQIIINEVDGKLYCNECGEESTIEEPYLIFCHKCQSQDVKIIEGKDFFIEKIEIEE